MTSPSPAALAILALCACSSEAPRNEAIAAATPVAAATISPAVAATPGGPRDSGAVPRPGELKTFGDWTVGCDNMLTCELRSLGPDNAPPSGVTMAVSRAAGPDGRIALSIGSDEADDLTPAIDGKRFDSPARVVAAMANARALNALTGGKVVATVSLKGVSAALRYVDAVQGRAGTVTAFVAKGVKPARAVPTAVALPTIVAVTPTGKAATPTAAQLADMRRVAACDAQAPGDPQAFALGGGKTLVLLPCSSGAYNLLSSVFVVDGRTVTSAKADAPVGFDATGADGPKVTTVVNGDWRDGVLTSYAKGRGLGDCGVVQELVWDGTRLRLSLQRAMGECRGNIDYIPTWRANVVRR